MPQSPCASAFEGCWGKCFIYFQIYVREEGRWKKEDGRRKMEDLESNVIFASK